MRSCLPTPVKVYKKVKRAKNLEELPMLFPGAKAFIDAT